MRFRRNTTRKAKAGLDMTPMIDVTFQLIIFFMLSSTFVVQSSVPIELSRITEGTVQPEKKELSVTLTREPGGPDEGGKIFADDQPVNTWSELRAILVALHEKDPEATVLIRPDKNTPTERLLQVLGMANACGIIHYGVAAEQPIPGGE